MLKRIWLLIPALLCKRIFLSKRNLVWILNTREEKLRMSTGEKGDLSPLEMQIVFNDCDCKFVLNSAALKPMILCNSTLLSMCQIMQKLKWCLQFCNFINRQWDVWTGSYVLPKLHETWIYDDKISNISDSATWFIFFPPKI